MLDLRCMLRRKPARRNPIDRFRTRLRQKHGSWRFGSCLTRGFRDVHPSAGPAARIACERSRSRNIRAPGPDRADDGRERRRDRQRRIHRRRERGGGDRHRGKRSRGPAAACGDPCANRQTDPLRHLHTRPSGPCLWRRRVRQAMEPSSSAIGTCRGRWRRADHSISMHFAGSWARSPWMGCA